MRAPLTQETLEKYRAAVGSLASAFDLINDHVVITDAHANIIYANRAAEKASGYTFEEMVGKNPADLWGGNMPKEFYEQMWRAIKFEKKPFSGEVKNIRKDGTEAWQEMHISPVLNKSGEPQYFIAIEPDISSRKRFEELNGEFDSIVGHQLKSPLTAIRLVLEWLKDAGGLTPDQKDALEGAYKKTEGLSELVADLITLRRLDYAHAQGEQVDLKSEIEQVISSLKTQFSSKKLEFSYASNTEYMIASHQLLARQVFTNIISNALEYSNKEHGEVSVGLEAEPSMFIFRVTDNGVGIPEADKPRIFGRFFRASNALTAKENGTGLGLFIVKMICESFSWKVRFESEEGKGTTFFVEIPR